MGCSINKNKATTSKLQYCHNLPNNRQRCACLQRIYERRLIYKQRSQQNAQSQQQELIKNNSQILHDPPSSSLTVRNETKGFCITNREKVKSILKNSNKDKSSMTTVSKRVTFE